MFLMKGKTVKRGYTAKFLKDHGASPGSHVIMTENTFMTIEAWEQMTPLLIEGYRKVNKYVEANPQWYMVDILDGFGAHHNSYLAMAARHSNKIISVKEEGDSSHVNQAYDNLVARNDKKTTSSCLGFLRKFRYHDGTVLDQWDLIHIVLCALRDTTAETWKQSFENCNLNPHTRISFPEWCKRIEPFL